MLLSTLQSLNSDLTVEVLQEAYYDIVRKIRLYPAVFPVNLTGIQGVDDFSLKAILPNYSEVAIKEIISVHGCSLNTELPITGSLSALELGNPTATSYGLSNYNNLNNSHIKTPDIIQYENTFYCVDTDPAMFFILVYPYPYAVTIVGSDPFTDKHLYDIQDMIDEGDGASTLDICDMLLYLIVPKAMAIIYQQNDDIAYSTRYDNLTSSLINLFNRNPAFVKMQKISTIGKIVGGEI